MSDLAVESSLDELLSAPSPWLVLDRLGASPSDELTLACERRFDAVNAEGRKRLIWLLERIRTNAAFGVLLRRLSRASGDEAAQLLRVLNGARVAVPVEQIARLFEDAAQEAIVAAGIAGDATLVPRVAAFLDKPNLVRHAALALAMLGQNQLASELVARLDTTKGLDCTGILAALEVMGEPSVAEALRARLLHSSGDAQWDLHHAIFRLTGREPLVRWATSRDDARAAFAEAWKSFDLGAAPRPRLTDITLETEGKIGAFQVHDGLGRLRIDFDPPSPGSAWPRWSQSLYAGDVRLFDVGSFCGTCETTLRLVGLPEASVPRVAADVREAVANVEALDEGLLIALTPYLTTLRTGHYIAFLVDLDLERVQAPERSWLTRRAEYRKRDEPGEPEEADIQWPGLEHFQAREAALGDVPTYGLLLPQSALESLRSDRIDAWDAALSRGAHPTTLAMCWVEQKEVQGEHPERFFVGLVLDGHHKLAAAVRRRQPARILAICRLEDSSGPPDDRARWLRQSVAALERARSHASVTNL